MHRHLQVKGRTLAWIKREEFAEPDQQVQRLDEGEIAETTNTDDSQIFADI